MSKGLFKKTDENVAGNIRAIAAIVSKDFLHLSRIQGIFLAKQVQGYLKFAEKYCLIRPITTRIINYIFFSLIILSILFFAKLVRNTIWKCENSENCHKSLYCPIKVPWTRNME